MAGAALELTEPIVGRFLDLKPDVRVTFEHHLYDDPSAGLLNGSTDVAFLRPPLDARSVIQHPLLVEPRVAVLSSRHALARRSSLSLDDLSELDIVRPDGPDERWNTFWGLGDRSVRTTTARTLEAALEIVASSRSVSIAALGWLRFFPRRGLVGIPVEGVVGSVLSVGRLRGVGNDLAQTFVRVARQVSGERLAGVPEAVAP
jgi:DNA-binding transcriptional LysR family regulator